MNIIVPSRKVTDDDRPRVLVVDDNLLCRELVAMIMEPYADCTRAEDGKQAINIHESALRAGKRFDLIFLDIMMPDIDGHEVLRVIRRIEERNGIYGSDRVKVIMTTALRDSKHCIQSFREGCECYLTKPVVKKELLAKVVEQGILDRETVMA